MMSGHYHHQPQQQHYSSSSASSVNADEANPYWSIQHGQQRPAFLLGGELNAAGVAAAATSTNSSPTFLHPDNNVVDGRFLRHRSLPPPQMMSSATTLPAGFGRQGVRRGFAGRPLPPRPGEEQEEDIYESIYDSRWKLMQKVSQR